MQHPAVEVPAKKAHGVRPQAAASIGLSDFKFCAVPSDYYSRELEERRALLDVRAGPAIESIASGHSVQNLL